MTGLMCCFKDAGWTAPAPQDWQKDGVSHAVEYDDPIELIQLVQPAQDKLEHELWITAACHKGGQGAQGGVDFHVAPGRQRFRPCVRSLKGLLTTCKFCNAKPTLKHLMWECP